MYGLLVFLLIVIIWYFYVYSPGRVVVSVCYFFKPGCPACEATKSYWNEFATSFSKSNPNIQINPINVASAEGAEHADKYGVKYVPMLSKTRKNGEHSFYEGGKIFRQGPKLLVEGWDVKSLTQWASI